jgi:hypothetical protein
MAGVNLLKQLRREEVSQEAVVSKFSLGGGALEDLSSYQKFKLLLLFLGFFVYYFGRDHFNTTYLPSKLVEPQAQLERINNEIAAAKRKLSENEEITKAANAYEQQIQELRRKIQTIENIKKSNRDKVLRMVDFIVSKMPEPVWISELKLEAKAGTDVDLQGFSMSYQTISTFFSRLEDAVFFRDWQLIESSLTKVKGPTGDDIDASKFQLRAQVAEVP